VENNNGPDRLMASVTPEEVLAVIAVVSLLIFLVVGIFARCLGKLTLPFEAYTVTLLLS